MFDTWNAYAEYKDGTAIDKNFTHYNVFNSYEDECNYQQHLEEWLMNQHQGITFYSVCIIDSD